ncbi:hypothetical protein LTS18_000757, partial [Coniosporium uncinatum]
MAGVSDGNAATSSTHVEDAIASLFSNADSMMHYTPNGEANAAASLKYRVALSLELDLDTDWALLDTLTLTNVNLKVALSKSSDESTKLAVQISAVVHIQDVAFQITGTIPRIQSGKDTDFSLRVQMIGTLDTLNPLDFVDTLTKQAIPKSDVVNALDSTLAEQVSTPSDGTAPGQQLLLDAELRVRRIGSGADAGHYYLKSIKFAMSGSFPYSIIPGSLELEGASLAFKWSYNHATSTWKAFAQIRGYMVVQQLCHLTVEGQLSIAESKSMILAISARSISGTSPEKVFDSVLGASAGTLALQSLRTPASLNYPDAAFDPFQVKIT